MRIQDITSFLEKTAPLRLQEDYDNAGLITGDAVAECTGVLVTLDATEDVIKEAIEKKINLVVAHHPIVFRGLKKLNGKNYVERAVILAVKNDICIYAIHTNLDNVIGGVNGRIADQLGLVNRRVLLPKQGFLRKLAVFVPVAGKEKLLDALFEAGAGSIGKYSECSFSLEGEGTFRAGVGTDPFVGKQDERHAEKEQRVEVIFPDWLTASVLKAMRAGHPYEEIAYDLYRLENSFQETGSGLVGELPEAVDEKTFLKKLSALFHIPVIRHTPLRGKTLTKIALCGGAGSFLTSAAIAAGADCYLTADIKYHEFFDADNRLILCDIGHFESEQFTSDLLMDLLRDKFPNFAVLKTGVNTNPVCYFRD